MRTICPCCTRCLPAGNFIAGNPACLRCRNKAARRSGRPQQRAATRKDGAYYRQRNEEIAFHSWKKRIAVKPVLTVEQQILRDIQKGRHGEAVMSGQEMADVFSDILQGDESATPPEPSGIYDEELGQWVDDGDGA